MASCLHAKSPRNPIRSRSYFIVAPQLEGPPWIAAAHTAPSSTAMLTQWLPSAYTANGSGYSELNLASHGTRVSGPLPATSVEFQESCGGSRLAILCYTPLTLEIGHLPHCQ